jgi:WD40 repeat protein
MLIAFTVPTMLAAAPAKKPVWKDFALAATLRGHTSLVRCAAFAPDGATLATGGSDRSLRLWDPATGKARAVIELPRSG